MGKVITVQHQCFYRLYIPVAIDSADWVFYIIKWAILIDKQK